MPRPKGVLLDADTFQALLDARGMSQREVAERSGMSAQTISALYRRTTRASLATAEQVAAALGCAPAALFPELGGWSPGDQPDGPRTDADAGEGDDIADS